MYLGPDKRLLTGECLRPLGCPMFRHTRESGGAAGRRLEVLPKAETYPRIPRVLVGVRTCIGAPRESYRSTPFASESVAPPVVRFGL